MKQVIVPGEKVDAGVTTNTYLDKGNNYSAVLGLFEKRDDQERLVALSGKYLPVEGDYVIGIVTEPKFGGCVVDINSPYDAFLPSPREYSSANVVIARIDAVTEVRGVTLGEEKKLVGGDVLEISPVRVARVIGKKNSMLDMLRTATKCDIFVGRNGRIWLKGGDMAKAEKAILKIEREAHTDGLTERIQKFLQEK